MSFFKIFPAAAVAAFQLEKTLLNEKIEAKANHGRKLQENLSLAKEMSRGHVRRRMQEVGAPGMVIAVSVDGKTVWSEGFGLADVENNVPCTTETVMRVASISKSFTATAMARLWEAGKLDLDKPIQEYLPKFPEKTYEGEKVVITLRHLLSHTGGIRHYHKSTVDEDAPKPRDQPKTLLCDKCKAATESEYNLDEYYITKPCKTMQDALDIFKDDPLVQKPGSGYYYTTFGWTVISAILEKASGQEFLTLMQDTFARLGMANTVPDFHKKLTYNRSRYYSRDKEGKLVNVPYVDCSYKWAGGGFLSTVGDLIKFGNAMIYSYQMGDSKTDLSGILKSDTVKKMWSAVVKPTRAPDSKSAENQSYGLGWFVYPEMEQHGCCPDWQLEVAHTGGAIGASSILFLLPNTSPHQDLDDLKNPTLCCSQLTDNEDANHMEDHILNETSLISSSDLPVGGIGFPLEQGRRGVKGISVAILTNMQAVSLTSLARSIAHEFHVKLSRNLTVQ